MKLFRDIPDFAWRLCAYQFAISCVPESRARLRADKKQNPDSRANLRNAPVLSRARRDSAIGESLYYVWHYTCRREKKKSAEGNLSSRQFKLIITIRAYITSKYCTCDCKHQTCVVKFVREKFLNRWIELAQRYAEKFIFDFQSSKRAISVTIYLNDLNF